MKKTDDGTDAISIIRQMFWYNPKKYAHIDIMVSNFCDIQAEERRSRKRATTPWRGREKVEDEKRG